MPLSAGDRLFGSAAAHRVAAHAEAASHQGVSVVLHENAIRLNSADRFTAALGLIWQAALLNEHFVEDGCVIRTERRAFLWK